MIENDLSWQKQSEKFCIHNNLLSSCPICKNRGKKTREFVSIKGQQETDPATLELEEIEGQQELDKEIEKILTQIDFDLLEKLYFEIATKSGLDPLTINFVGRDRITGYDKPETSATSQIARSKIYLNKSAQIEEAKRLNLSLEAVVLHNIVHEEIHLVNRAFYRGLYEYNSNQSDNSEQHTGYNFIRHYADKRGKDAANNSFSLFNEGVTEKLSREISLRYVTSKGLSDPAQTQQAIKIFNNFPTTRNEDVIQVYDLAVYLIDLMIQIISKISGFSQEKIWQGIIRGQFEGENLTTGGLRILMNETFGKNFMQRLENANGDDLLKLIEEVEQKNNSTK